MCNNVGSTGSRHDPFFVRIEHWVSAITHSCAPFCSSPSHNPSQPPRYTSCGESSHFTSSHSLFLFTLFLVINGTPLIGGGRGVGFRGARSTVPFLVALEIDTAEGSFLCGGAIVSPTAILSAAHCVTDSSGRRLMAPTVTVVITNNRDIAPLWRGRGRVTVNPGYRDNAENDLIVVTLSSPIPIGGDIQPIPLASANPRIGAWAMHVVRRRKVSWRLLFLTFSRVTEPRDIHKTMIPQLPTK